MGLHPEGECMTRVRAADACVQSDSIKGLAQSIAKPAYHRLVLAEPTLRRAVPTLIIAFLVTICVGAFVQVVDQSRLQYASARKEVTALADLVADRLERPQSSRQERAAAAERLQALLPGLMPSWGIAAGRHVLVVDDVGRVLARTPEAGSADRRSGRRHSLRRRAVADADLARRRHRGAAAERRKRAGRAAHDQADVAAAHRRAGAAQRAWLPQHAALSITLSATTGFVVLILGFAFHWQSTRAREGDLINDAVRGRIDTALNRGRCGLWDWDLSRGRIFWSQSMFTMLGLESRSDLLTFGEVNALVRSDDIDLFHFANQLIAGHADSFDETFRMRHVHGHWIWLRVRCELVRSDDGGTHLIGIALDITEQKSLAAKTVEADLRLRDAIETIPEAFVLWDADNRLVLCNSYFQRLHKLPDTAIAPGTSYETVVEVGRMPQIRERVADGSSQEHGAQTFEAQLDDGRWLHISERRTKDGGYVSVGTDITTIKAHEHKLLENDGQLRASVKDLQAVAGGAEAAGRRACRSGAEIRAGEDPRRGSQRHEIALPRQYEP